MCSFESEYGKYEISTAFSITFHFSVLMGASRKGNHSDMEICFICVHWIMKEEM